MFSRDKGFVIIVGDSPGDKIYWYKFRIRVVNPKLYRTRAALSLYRWDAFDRYAMIGS
jgi:hypothetical protein